MRSKSEWTDRKRKEIQRFFQNPVFGTKLHTCSCGTVIDPGIIYCGRCAKEKGLCQHCGK